MTLVAMVSNGNVVNPALRPMLQHLVREPLAVIVYHTRNMPSPLKYRLVIDKIRLENTKLLADLLNLSVHPLHVLGF